MKLLALLIVGTIVLALPASAADKRPMALDDLFKFKRVSDPQVSPDGRWVVYVVGTVDLAANKSSTNLWLAASDGSSPPRQLTTTDKKDSHPRWSPDGRRILFESTRSGDGQLWVIDLAGGEARQLTTISTEAGSAIWSRDGRQIAFQSAVFPEFSEKPYKESNEANRKKMEEAKNSPVKAKVFKRLFYRHWDSYVEDKRQHLFVASFDAVKGTTGEPKDVTPGDRDAAPTSTTFSSGEDFTFSPDGTHLLFTAVPAEGEAWATGHDICRVPVTGGTTTWETLTKNKAADSGPQFSPDGAKLAYRAQKKPGYEADKWNLMVVAVDGSGAFKGEPKSATDGLDRSADGFTWAGNGVIYFTADHEAGVAVFRADLAANTVTPALTGGQHGSLSYAGDHMAFTIAAMTHPNEVYADSPEKRFTGDGTSSTIPVPVEISKANADLLAQLNTPQPESVEVPVEGGKMQMWILKPPGFDPSKKWPVAYLVHGGPQGAWENGWSYRWNPTLWAAQGYVVALPNPRGSTGFGQTFTDQICGDWGGKCYRDLMAGADAVEKLPYVDKDRIGAAGASFGGYMMDWFAVNTGRFKCLISHCSVWNFESMWGTTDELWFDEYEHGGLPWEYPDRYREFSPHTKAANLGKFKTPMLLIQNDNDFRCPVGQGIELFNALQRQSVPSKFINFPDEGHWVLKPKNSEFWHKEVFAWLARYVPPGGK